MDNDNLICIDTNYRHVGIWATNRQRLIDCIIDFTGCIHSDDPIWLRIENPCGEVLEIVDVADIPFENISCTCGNPDHWFIRYGEGVEDGEN